MGDVRFDLTLFVGGLGTMNGEKIKEFLEWLRS